MKTKIKNRRPILILSLALALQCAQGVSAQQFALSGMVNTEKWTPANSWKGSHELPGVYCLSFPNSHKAVELTYAPYNNNAIFFTSVLYGKDTLSTIVVSTIPPGRTREFEVARLTEGERQAEKFYGVPYHISEFKTAFGPTIGLRINNVADASRAKIPFPLVRPPLAVPEGELYSMSVHRLFVRGENRFEVASWQLAKQPTSKKTESTMAAALTKFTDEVVAALQDCTAKLPLQSTK